MTELRPGNRRTPKTNRRSVNRGGRRRNKIQNQLNYEESEKEKLIKQQKEFRSNETQIRKQLKTWRDLKALLDIKQKCLKQQMEDKARNQYSISGRVDHLVL